MLDHDTIAVVMTMPAIVPATVVVVPAVATLDDDLLGVGNGRRRDGNRTDSGNNVSKFLHGGPPPSKWTLNFTGGRNVPHESEENSERLFSFENVPRRIRKNQSMIA
jgi:hypothetical protein